MKQIVLFFFLLFTASFPFSGEEEVTASESSNSASKKDEAMQIVSGTSLRIGAARSDITPTKRVPLWGQFVFRLSQGVDTPLTANVVAVESTRDRKSVDQAIFVSVDILLISSDLLHAIKEKIAARHASIVPEKIVVSATHTHTGPTPVLDSPKLPVADDIMDYPELVDFIAGRIADAVVEAWENRKPGKVAFGLDYGVIGWNRRAVYAGGKAEIRGNTNRSDFRMIEAVEDHDIGSLFFMDGNNRLLAVAVNVATPSQIVGSLRTVNADFWHPVREVLAKRFGDEVVVLGWCGSCGDSGPHPLYRSAAIARMNTLRRLNAMQEAARKIDRAVADTWEAVRTTGRGDIPLVHRVESLQLPMRKVTEEQYVGAKAEYDKIRAALKANPNKAPAEVDWMPGGWHGCVLKRYELQQKDPEARYSTTIHVIRLGETAILTNQFELFTEYGIRMKARCPAVQTFVIQLTDDGQDIGSYLPTEKAVHGGSYSAIIQSTPVGPEGGQILVDETVRIADELFPKKQ